MLTSSLIDVPRPYIDPIDSLVEALGVTSLALTRPLRDRTILLAMDDHRRGLGMVASGELSPIVVHHLIGAMCRIPGATSAFLVSTRGRELIRPLDVTDLLSHTAAMGNAGVRLHDWVVIGRGGFYCPRSMAGIADPWPSVETCL